MATFTVWRFDSPDAAENTLSTLERLQKQELIQVHDAAVVTYPVGAKKPRTRQLHGMAGSGALGGAFWGMLFGLIFFVPLLGMAVGAAAGALARSLTDVGIDDGFIKEVREQVTPGTSALFLLTSGAVVDRVKDEVAAAHTGDVELIHTNLSREEEARLRAAFTEDDVVAGPSRP
jgi:uncharacterized membrane protein